VNAETAWQLVREELDTERAAAPPKYRSRFRYDYLKGAYKSAKACPLGALDYCWSDSDRLASMVRALEAEPGASDVGRGPGYAARLLKVVHKERQYARDYIERDNKQEEQNG
jgi:hypothetical protein